MKYNTSLHLLVYSLYLFIMIILIDTLGVSMVITEGFSWRVWVIAIGGSILATIPINWIYKR